MDGVVLLILVILGVAVVTAGLVYTAISRNAKSLSEKATATLSKKQQETHDEVIRVREMLKQQMKELEDELDIGRSQ